MKKILVCGVGSIGERHINNLISLGYKDIILYRTRNKKLRTVKGNFLTFKNLSEALKQKPDVAIISNPTHLHLKIATECAKSNCHVFIEKPISQNIKGYRKLKNLMIKNKRHIMVGYMMRYHPCVIKMKEWYELWSKGGAGPNFRIDNPEEYIKNFNWISNWIDIYFFNKVSDFILGIILLICIF